MGWAFAVLAYLLGSVPTGIIVARSYGVNIRAAGSGNIGATNALRVIGKKAGVLTLAGDMLKGVLAVFLALHFAGREAGVLAAGAAVLGHDFPVYTMFRGGKGVATSFGVLLMLEPYLALIGIGVWAVTVAAGRISSLGALVSFCLLPLWTVLLRGSDTRLIWLSSFLTALILIRHRENIVRLARGEEPKVGQKHE